MGFLDMMKKAMGFSTADDDELEVEGIDATVTPLRQRVLSHAKSDNPDDGDVDNDSSSVDAAAAQDMQPTREKEPGLDVSVIFEGVVRQFNEALPSFIRESVEPEKQRRLLFDSLDSSIKDYFEHLEKNVDRRLRIRYEADSRKLQEQIEELRRKAIKEEEGNSNAKNLQLSAERQKRALSERVHELEKQLASIEAENEQYILENKTMANKLRLAAMSDREIDDSCQEIIGREAELSAREASVKEREAALQEQLEVMESRLDESARKLAEAEARAAADDSSKMADLENEIALLRDSLQQAKAKDELSRAMVNDLNSRAADARKLAVEKEERATELQIQLDSANEQLATLNARLVKAQEDLQIVREVQDQVVKLEESQRVSDARLRRQTDELMEKDELIRAKDADLLTKNTTLRLKDETIRRLEDQADSLRKSVETAQFEKTQTESALRSEIERLKSLKGIAAEPEPVAPAQEAEIEIPVISTSETDLDLALDLPELITPEAASISAPKPRRGRPPKQRPSADQDAPPADTVKKKGTKPSEDDTDLSLLDSTDWLIATPVPENNPKPKRQRKQKADPADDAFGYKEPVRQEPPDNPAQMLLW